MGYSARLLLDSVSPGGVRLVTMEARYPRFIHAELMTHRVFCLHGDTQLYFDLPSAYGGTKRYAMTIEEFHAKWHRGSAERRPKKRTVTATHISPDRWYTSRQAATLLGYRHYSAVDLLARRLGLERRRLVGSPSLLSGRDLANCAKSPQAPHRYSLRSRLKKMQLRCCNEDTRLIGHTHVTDVVESGLQPVFKVTLADGKTIMASAGHRFLTDRGWKTLEEATDLSLSAASVASWKPGARLAVNGLPALEDLAWLQHMRNSGFSASAIAAEIGVSLDRVKCRFRRYGIKASNPNDVWHRSHTRPPWNKGRRYCNLKTRGTQFSGRVRRGPECHFWRGGITQERKLIGVWTQHQAFGVHRANSFKCRLCLSNRELHAPHLDPVANNLERAYDRRNLTTLCRVCHGELHQRNLELELLRHLNGGSSFGSFWTRFEGRRLRRPFRSLKRRTMVAHFVDLIAVEYVGIRPTFDLSVEGPYHNFIANGFVVHNSRNAASSRAIPIKRMIAAVRQEPAMPIFWGKNQPGMSARREIDDAARSLAKAEWGNALLNALATAERLSESDVDLHKQLVNRILEPFAWITVIITATEWANFFTQRCHPDAQPEIKHLADLMLAAFRGSVPRVVELGQWHLPLIQHDEGALDVELRKRLSVARCARVSYLTHEGARDHEKDLELFERLVGGGANGHWSPFEHVATPLGRPDEFIANFRGWNQFRKFFAEENARSFPDEIAR